MFSLESPHRSDSYTYTQHIIINIEKKITPNYPKYNNLQLLDFSKGLEKFETAMVNKPSVFEPLKFYCICILNLLTLSYPMDSVADYYTP